MSNSTAFSHTQWRYSFKYDKSKLWAPFSQAAFSGAEKEVSPLSAFASACLYELYWYEIFHQYHVNKYRAISKNRDDLVPEWNSYRYHVNTPLD